MKNLIVIILFQLLTLSVGWANGNDKDQTSEEAKSNTKNDTTINTVSGGSGEYSPQFVTNTSDVNYDQSFDVEKFIEACHELEHALVDAKYCDLGEDEKRNFKENIVSDLKGKFDPSYIESSMKQITNSSAYLNTYICPDENRKDSTDAANIPLCDSVTADVNQVNKALCTSREQCAGDSIDDGTDAIINEQDQNNKGVSQLINHAPAEKSDCYKYGNDIFRAGCNAFHDSIVLGKVNEGNNKAVFDIGGNLIFATQHVFEMSSDKSSCEHCLAKAYEKIADNNSSFEEDKETATADILEKLKEKALKANLVKLSSNIEDMVKMKAIYGKSIDKSLEGLDLEQQQKEMDAVLCKDDSAISQAIENNCSQTGIDPLKAKKSIMNTLASMKDMPDSKDLSAGLTNLYKNVRYQESSNKESCSEDFDLEQYYRIKHKMNNDLVQDNLTVPSVAVYKILEVKEIGLSEVCMKKGQQIESPLVHLRNKVKDLILSDSEQLSDIEKSLKSGISEYITNLKENKNKQAIFLGKHLSEDTDETHIVNRIFSSATNNDVGLNNLLNDWDTICDKKKIADELNQPIQKIVDAQVDENGKAFEKNSDKRHKYIYDEMKKYAQKKCGTIYKTMAKLSCANSKDLAKNEAQEKRNEFLDDFSSGDIKSSAEQIYAEQQDKSENSSFSESPQKIIALGAFTCSHVNSEDIDDFKNDYRGLRVADHSAYSIDMLNNDPNNNLYSSRANHPFNSIANLDDPSLYCDSREDQYTQMKLNQSIYGIEPTAEDRNKVLYDYYAANSDSLGDVPEFLEKSVGAGTMAGKGKREPAGLDGADGIKASAFDQTNTPKTATNNSFNYDSNQGQKSNNSDQTSRLNEKYAQKQSERTVQKYKEKVESGEYRPDAAYEAWLKEKEQMQRQHQKELSALRKEIDAVKSNDNLAAGEKSQKVKDLEKRMSDLQAKKDALAKTDNEMKQMMDKKSQIEKKVSAGSFDKGSKGNSSANKSSSAGGSRGIANYSGGGSANSFSGVLTEPRSNYQTGLGGVIHTQNASDAVIKLKEIAGSIESGELDVEFIKVGDVPKFIKIPGQTQYIKIAELRQIIEQEGESSPLKGLLEKYLLSAEESKSLQNMAASNEEVKLIGIEDVAQGPPARLSDMKMALEFTIDQCQQKQQLNPSLSCD